MPFLGPHVTAEQVRLGSTVEYNGQALTVRGPNGEQLSVPGYAPQERVGKQLPSIYVKCAAERHKDRSDAERRNEGFPSW